MHGEKCNIYLTYCKADATIKEEIRNYQDCVTGNETGGLEDERKCGVSAWDCGRGVVSAVGEKKRGRRETDYDERQYQTRDRACRYSFLTLLFYELLYGALYSKEAPSWCDYTMGNYLGIALALLVFGVYCIWNDAYMNLNQKPWSVHLLFGVLALCNFGIAENNQRIGVLFADGKLGFGAVNLVFAVMFVVFEIVFLIKRSREKRDLSEEKAE